MMDAQNKPLEQPLKKSKLITIIIIGICVVLNLFFLVNLSLPQFSEISAKRNELEQKKADLTTAAQQFTITEQVTDKQKEKLLSELPAISLGSKQLTIIHDLVKDSKLEFAFFQKIEKTEQASESNDENIQTESFDVKVVGHLENILLYLNNIQNNKPIMSVPIWKLSLLEFNNIDATYPELFENPNMVKNKPMYELSLTIDLYVMPQLAAVFKLEEQPKADESDAMKILQDKYPKLKLDERD